VLRESFKSCFDLQSIIDDVSTAEGLVSSSTQFADGLSCSSIILDSAHMSCVFFGKLCSKMATIGRRSLVLAQVRQLDHPVGVLASPGDEAHQVLGNDVVVAACKG